VVAEPTTGDVFGEVNQSSAHSMIGASRLAHPPGGGGITRRRPVLSARGRA
jgi:hypothetical protein